MNLDPIKREGPLAAGPDLGAAPASGSMAGIPSHELSRAQRQDEDADQDEKLRPRLQHRVVPFQNHELRQTPLNLNRNRHPRAERDYDQEYDYDYERLTRVRGAGTLIAPWYGAPTARESSSSWHAPGHNRRSA